MNGNPNAKDGTIDQALLHKENSTIQKKNKVMDITMVSMGDIITDLDHIIGLALTIGLDLITGLDYITGLVLTIGHMKDNIIGLDMEGGADKKILPPVIKSMTDHVREERMKLKNKNCRD